MEANKITGSEKGEHNRTDYISGTRERRFDTRLGTFNLQIPKFRNTGYVPFFMQNKATCTEFFNKLKARGHEKVWLCVSDAHAGLQAAIKNINASYSLAGDSCCLCFEYKIHLDFFSRVKNYKDNLPLKSRLSFFY